MQELKPASFRAMALLNDYVSTDLQLAIGGNQHSLTAVLRQVHGEILMRGEFAPVTRVAVALYHPSIDTAATLVESCLGGVPLGHYEAPMSTQASLRQMAASGVPRVTDEFQPGGPGRNAVLHAHGYRSSLACPIYSD